MSGIAKTNKDFRTDPTQVLLLELHVTKVLVGSTVELIRAPSKNCTKQVTHVAAAPKCEH